MAFESHSNVVLSALPITMDDNNNDLLLQALVLQHWLEAESDQETLENVQLSRTGIFHALFTSILLH